MKDLIGLLIPIIAILSTIALPLVLGIGYALKTERQKHIERMELIKQGLIPPTDDGKTPNRMKTLRNAIVLIGLGIGLIIGLAIVKSMNLDEEGAFWVIGPSILIFLGASHLVYFFLAKKYNETEED